MLIPVLLVILTAAIYLPHLSEAPAFLSNDEVCIALNARSIAATGRDVYGRFMPSLFYSPSYFTGARIWFLPMLVYTVALVLKMLPFGETAIRLPLVLAAIADVLLIYVIALRLWPRRSIAVCAAILLALAPAHLFHARLALPAQFSGPFVLGWLLCVLTFFERRQPRWLFASGVLLGLAAVGYIGPLALAYGLLTWCVLYQRRERWTNYAAIVAGGVVPCLYFLWLARDAAIVGEILGHYRTAPTAGGLAGHMGEVATLYWHFWSPDFLFVEGAVRNARAAGAIGVFLLPTAGLVLLGVARALRRRDPESILMLGGFLIAPIAASFVGESHAIWRALEVVPFGVLLAANGMDVVSSESQTPQARWTTYLTTLLLSIAVAVAYRDHLQHAQPMIRILVAPLALAGLALLLKRLDGRHLSIGSLTAAVAVLTITEFAYVTRVGDLVNILIPLAALLTLAAAATDAKSRRSETLAVCAVMALVAEFLFLHVDYPAVSRIGPLPASAVLAAWRTTTAVVVAAACAGALALIDRSRSRAAGFTSRLAWAAAGMAIVQAAYFHVDHFTDAGARFAFVAIILIAGLAVSMSIARVIADRRALPRLALVAIVTAAAVQFGYFYADYLTGYPTRNMVMAAGTVRTAWEQVIERSEHRTIPAVFIGPIGSYGDAGLYWRFYLIKHRREDLLSMTIENEPFERDRIRQLPAGSVVVASPSADVDRIVRDMEAAGEIGPAVPSGYVRSTDGTPLFWLVERRRR